MSLPRTLFIVILLLGVFLSKASAESQKINLAALLALTGSGADQGIRCQRGLQLAADEVKDEFDVHIRFEDTKGDPRTAVDAFRNVEGAETLAAFTWGSGVGMALTPVMNNARIIQMGLATGTPKYRSLDDYTFRTFHSSDSEANFVASAIASRWPDAKGAVLRINNEYGEGFFSVLKEELEKKNVSIVFEDSFLPGTVDFRSQLTRLKSKNPQFIIVVAYPAEGLAMIRQAKDLGLSRLPMIASGALFASEVFVDPIILSLPAFSIVLEKPASDTAAVAERARLSEKHQRMFAQPLDAYDFYTLRAYDAFMAIIAAARSCKQISADCVKDALYAAPEQRGAFYPIKFDKAGDTAAEFGFFVPGKKDWGALP